LADQLEEAKRIVDDARSKGITLRLLGGMACRLHCHGPHSRHLRSYRDIDVIGLKKQHKRIEQLLGELGYVPNRRFNFLYGGQGRLQFYDPSNRRNIDILLDKFEMQHVVDLRTRLDKDEYTIPVTDLLITKLQNVKLEKKDILDLIAILEDHEIDGSNKEESIDLAYLSRLSSRDWGLHKSLVTGIDRVEDQLEHFGLRSSARESVHRKIDQIRNAAESGQKTLRWRLRAIIGARKKWYREVEAGDGEL
jgi:hypothetical protein